MAQLNKELENMTISKNKNKKDAKRLRKRLSISEAKNQSPLFLDGVKNKNKNKNVQQKLEKQSKGTNKSNIFTSYSMKSQVGIVPFNPNKVNQDRCILIPDLFNNTAALFGVFDGHGMFGDDVSQYLTDKMEQWFKNEKHKNLIIKDPKNALKQCFNDLTKSLANSKINCNFSGSTAVVSYIDKENIYTANVGDSRSVLCRNENNKLMAIPLSFDQKPDNLNEKKRIEKANGRVESCRGAMGEFIGPARVWLKNHDMPGLAMSRSFGDDIAASVGVISHPQIIIKKRNKNDQFIVAASDGIWEFLSNEDAVNIINEHKGDLNKSSRNLCKEATTKWEQEEEVIDDITCVIVKF